MTANPDLFSQPLWQYLDYLGVIIFAVTGGLVAARLRQDFIAFLFFCAITGIGGGTLRDLLLGVPVFWVENSSYLALCTAVAAVMWFTAEWVEARGRPLRWLDAAGISAYTVMGAAKALSLGHSASVAVLMGVSTATFGGITRDVIAGQPSALLQREIYLAAAFAGATTYVTLIYIFDAQFIAVSCGALAAFTLRAGAIAYGWSWPSYTPSDEKLTHVSKKKGEEE
ncbi:trimeric intracellular cation channel family protein [Polycladidibacter hongkongensis]|uniref:trimeric intracellular cation channel family protein n=1 Tax=Polycladidibacter hongkongensis TaxID=1647556 RepID=UPI00082D4DA1|nr:trimeric intracellular cation channel family protein [Pseudovibrio hongkongensis]